MTIPAEPAPPRGDLWLGVALKAGLVLLVAMALAPLAGPAAGARVGVVMVLGALAGMLVLSKRDGCAVLSLLVFLLFLVPENYVIVGPLKSVGSPVILTGLAALVLWAASRVLTSVPTPEFHPIRWAFLFFAIAATASYAAGMARELTSAEDAGMDRVVFQVLALLGAGLLAVDELLTPDRITVLLQRVVIAGGIGAFIGVIEFMSTGFDYREMMRLPGLTTNVDVIADTRSGFDRIAAAASHPIEFAVVSAALVPLALHFSIHATSGRWRYRLALTAMLVAVPISVSRSGFLALAVALAFYVVTLRPRAQFNVMVLGVIGLGVFRAAVPGLLGTALSLFRDVGTDPSIEGRTEDYAAIPALMEGHWWLGRGLGTFLPNVYFFLDNQYLGCLLAGGVVGLVAFITLHVVGVGVARGVRHRTDDPELASEGQALAAVIAALGVAAIAYDSLNFRQGSFVLFVVLGCAGARWTLLRHQPKPSERMEEERWPVSVKA